MNFQQLEYVLAVDNHKHFGHAAESCHITQATLSGMIKKLEQELGIFLFDRKRQPVQTTDAGRQFIELARKILMHKSEMYQLNKATLTELSGSLRLGIIPTIANSLLPIVLPSLLKENPKLQLTIVEITTEEIKQQLMVDKIDLGILATPLEEDLLEESILYYEPMMVYGAHDPQKKYVSSKDIKNRKIWLLEEGNCFRNQAMSICEMQEKKMESSNLNFAGSSFDTLLNLTDKFGGFTLVPELYFKEMAPAKQQLTKSFQTPIPVREISLVSYRPFAKKQTVDFLSARMIELVKPHLSTGSYHNKDLDIIGL